MDIPPGTQRIAEYLVVLGPVPVAEQVEQREQTVLSSTEEIRGSREPNDLRLNAALICKFPEDEHRELPLPKVRAFTCSPARGGVMRLPVHASESVAALVTATATR